MSTSSWPLHQAIWRNHKNSIEDLKRVVADIQDFDIDCKDLHGNACLHISAHFGDESYEVTKWLLQDLGAQADLLSDAGMKPFDEAISSGSRKTAALILHSLHEQQAAQRLRDADALRAEIRSIPDCSWNMKWQFQILGTSFLGNFAPSDTYQVRKLGDMIRVDYTLVGFQAFNVTRANMSLLLRDGHLYAINHDEKSMQDFNMPPGGKKYEKDLNKALDYFLAHDVCSHEPKGTPEFKAVNGWLYGQQSSDFDGYEAEKWHAEGLTFDSVIRSDPHAKRTRIPRENVDAALVHEERSAAAQYFREGGHSYWMNGLTWSTERIKRKVRSFDGTVYISDDFPLDAAHLRPLTRAFAPTSEAWKHLSWFLSLDMPAGFPLQVQIPVFWGVKAIVSTTDFQGDPPPASLFEVPTDYTLKLEFYLGNEAREMMKGTKSKSPMSEAHQHEEEEEEQVNICRSPRKPSTAGSPPSQQKKSKKKKKKKKKK